MEEKSSQIKQMEDMMRMFEIMQTMKSLFAGANSTNQEEINSQSYNAEIESINKQVHTPAIQSIKAAIPHLEAKYRKNLTMMIKMIEIQKLLSIYSEKMREMSELMEGTNIFDI